MNAWLLRRGVTDTATVSTINLVSRGLTAYSSTGTAANAISSNYASKCALTGDPAYVAVDLSSIVGAIKPDSSGFCALAYRWVAGNGIYQPDLHGDSNASLPGSFTIDSNTAAGGSLPGSGWNTEQTKTSYKCQSGSGIIDVSGGKKWFRMPISLQADGSTGGTNYKVDLWGAGRATNAAHTILTCGWATVGDSITNRTMNLDTVGQGGPSYTSFGDLVFAIKGLVPLQECMGVDGFTIGNIETNIGNWLNNSVAKNWLITAGTNDCIAGTSPSAFQTSFTNVLTSIKNAGRQAHVTTMPYGTYSQYATNAAALDSAIAAAIAAVPGTLNGPDFKTLVFNGTIALTDGIHPDNTGCQTWRSTNATYAANYGNGG
jgi:hypothetical protein